MSVWLWIVIGGVVLFFWGASRLANAFANQGIDFIEDEQGNRMIRDTPSMRTGATSAYDSTIQFELSGHQLSDGRTWNDDWLNTIRNIRKGVENPEWYVQYIIEQRRKAGLPELVWGEEEK